MFVTQHDWSGSRISPDTDDGRSSPALSSIRRVVFLSPELFQGRVVTGLLQDTMRARHGTLLTYVLKSPNSEPRRTPMIGWFGKI